MIEVYAFLVFLTALALVAWLTRERLHRYSQQSWDWYMLLGPTPSACPHCAIYDGEHHPCCPVGGES